MKISTPRPNRLTAASILSPENITDEIFCQRTGSVPVADDLERSNCLLGGTPGHFSCGWCERCNLPRFMCGHLIAEAMQ